LDVSVHHSGGRTWVRRIDNRFRSGGRLYDQHMLDVVDHSSDAWDVVFFNDLAYLPQS
jgi:hypothetical protein